VNESATKSDRRATDERRRTSRRTADGGRTPRRAGRDRRSKGHDVHRRRCSRPARARSPEPSFRRLPGTVQARKIHAQQCPARRGSAAERRGTGDLRGDRAALGRPARPRAHRRERPRVERELADVTERFVEHADAFLDRLRRSGGLPSDVLPARRPAQRKCTNGPPGSRRGAHRCHIPTSCYLALPCCFRRAPTAPALSCEARSSQGSG
jgi:hypothetical protein